MSATAAHIYLVKANDRLVSHCRCGDGQVTFPPQMDCPWCGCGWLFTCVSCRKAFTFATGIVVNESWEETARRDLRGRSKEDPSDEEVDDWVAAMKELLSDVTEGAEYVCLDGTVIPTTEAEIRFEGWHSWHDLPYVPQVAALSDPSVLQSTIGDPEYWRSTALPENEAV
jgi:hypothetical protein